MRLGCTTQYAASIESQDVPDIKPMTFFEQSSVFVFSIIHPTRIISYFICYNKKMKKIITENRNENTKDIDILPTIEIVKKINNEDKQVASAVEKEVENIASAVDIISKQFLKGGKLFYFGAGTSGRLGILDASECPPTYSVDYDMVQGIIAGGEKAIKCAIEGAEDDMDAGYNDAKRLTSKDVAVLISASGNPKYLLGVQKRAKEIGAKIIAVTCNNEAKILKDSDIKIVTLVGSEVITGSSRMKAGTAQKMILNMLTTSSMIKIGKTYENYMIDVKATNSKLKKRAIQIVMELCGIEEKDAEAILEKCNWKVKEAVLVIKKNVSQEEAVAILKAHNGVLRKALTYGQY